MRNWFAGTTVVGVVFVLAGGTAVAQPDPPPMREPPDVVVTSAEAVIKAAPDVAWVSLAVESRARAPRDAQRQNADAMSAMQQKLAGAGLPPDAVRTTSIELSPEFDYANGRQQLRGYLARNAVDVRVDALDRLGEIIDLSVGTGATNVTNVRFDVKRREELERAALKQAVELARARADAAAEGARRAVLRIIRIDDGGRIGEPQPRPMMMAARAEMAAAAPPTPVAPGELEVRARVTLTARLQ